MVRQGIKTNTMIVGCIAGLLCGVILPASISFSLFFLAVPIYIAALFVWAGWTAALFAVVSTLSIAFILGGIGFMTTVCVVGCMPGIVTALLVRKNTPFSRGMVWSVGVQFMAIVLTLAAIWMNLRTNLIDAFMVEARAAIGNVPATLVNSYLLQFGRYGFFGSNIDIDFTTTFLTVPERVRLIDILLGDLEVSLKLILPARIICSSVVTGGASYLWVTWISVRRGDDPKPDYVPVSQWRLPAHAIIGLPVCTVFCLILSNMGVAGTDSVYMAFLETMYLAFVIQAMGAMSRHMKQSGYTRIKRFWLIAFALVFGQFFLRWVGIYSALFGSQGLISTRMKKRMDDDDDGEDDGA